MTKDVIRTATAERQRWIVAFNISHDEQILTNARAWEDILIRFTPVKRTARRARLRSLTSRIVGYMGQLDEGGDAAD
jgi:hypothetical protein